MRRVFAAVAVALVAGGGVASAGQDKPVVEEENAFSYISPEVRAKMAAQDKAKSAANIVRQAVAQHDGTGFTSIALQGESVELAYKGPIPDAVNAAIDEARKTVPVSVKDAPYSLAELETASAEITEQLRTRPDGPAHSVEVTPDGGSLVVGVDQVTTLQALDLAEVAVPVRVAQRERMASFGRLDDTPPYWGGARIVSTDIPIECTSGFGVHAGGQRYLLTAGHCGRPDAGWTNGNGSRFIGNATHEHIDHDLLLIATDAGSRIYDGGVGVNEFSKAVSGWAWTAGNEWVCSSGSVSGVICNHVVELFNRVLCGYNAYGDYECYSGLVQTKQFDGLTAGRPGDSGGPVFGLDGDRVVAKGTITGGGGVTLLWQQFGTAVGDFGIAPLTS
ncbi:hypothetical protein [Amycolatopsis sp. YIM 10]|uniref:hypothetical protein n=1 Tax=Amycolatopsis sp. YIM 10 TaxID=2653857 RepID=UPI00129066DA|nr:hypothetical protein [Amycolatopsis sp. YIM 10]QFU90113.1 Streptogrisin-D precursor [Amycolatopsis sp. YIM 10]